MGSNLSHQEVFYVEKGPYFKVIFEHVCTRFKPDFHRINKDCPKMGCVCLLYIYDVCVDLSMYMYNYIYIYITYNIYIYIAILYI